MARRARSRAEATAGTSFNPSNDDTWSVLFKCLLVSRACDELTSRLGSRSDWLGIPLAGLDELLGGAGADLLFGQAGFDLLASGRGSDRLKSGSARDKEKQ